MPINDINLSDDLELVYYLAFLCVCITLIIIKRKIIPKELFPEDKESLSTIDFYNRYFADQGIPFFIVEDTRNIFCDYNGYHGSSTYLSDNIAKLHADDDFSSIWGLDPQNFLQKGVKEKFAINMDSYEAYHGIHTFRDLVNFVRQNLKPPSLTILFVCADNSCSSIMAEALANYLGRGRFLAFSASSHPVEKVNPFALSTLENNGLPTGSYRSKSWDEFANKKIDIMIVISDSAVEDSYPDFLNSAIKVHWPLPNPAQVTGTENETTNAFQAAYDALTIRIKQMLIMPAETMQPLEINRALSRIDSES